MARTYRSWVEIALLPFAIVFVAWFALLGLGLFVEFVFRLSEGRPITVGLLGAGLAELAFAVGFGWVLSTILTRYLTVRVGDDGSCVFRSVVRRTRVDVSDIGWLRPERDSETGLISGAFIGYRVGYSGRTLKLTVPSGGFAALTAHLRRLNPSIGISEELLDNFGRRSRPAYKPEEPRHVLRASLASSPWTCDRLVVKAGRNADSQTVQDWAGIEIGRVEAKNGRLILHDRHGESVLEVADGDSVTVADDQGRVVAVLPGETAEIRDAHGGRIGTIATRGRHPLTVEFADETGAAIGNVVSKLGQPHGPGLAVAVTTDNLSPELRRAMLGYAIHRAHRRAQLTKSAERDRVNGAGLSLHPTQSTEPIDSGAVNPSHSSCARPDGRTGCDRVRMKPAWRLLRTSFG